MLSEVWRAGWPIWRRLNTSGRSGNTFRHWAAALPARVLLQETLMEPALRLRSVTKTFGTTRAVDDLNLEVSRGATYGVIGPSGAGKTTCIRLIMSILFPDSGEISVLGHRSALEAKDRIGYLPEERGVYRKMRVADFITYIAQLKGVPAHEAGPRAATLLKRVGLEGV